MEAVLHGERVRRASLLTALAHALACLYRFGDHCWLSVASDSHGARLQLSAVNAAQSAFGLFAFDSAFFDSLTPHAASVECQLHVKSLLAILRAKGATRAVTLALNRDANRLDVRVVCENGMLRRHRLTYSDSPSMFPTVGHTAPFTLQASALHVREWLEHFGAARSGEVTIAADAAGCALRSTIDEPYDPRDHVRRAVHTEVRVALPQLELYDVTAQTCITFSLWEFRAAATVAEQFGMPLRLEFGAPGDPLSIYIEHAPVHAEFVIATAGDEAADDSDNAGRVSPDAVPSAPPPAPSVRRHAPGTAARSLSQLAPSQATQSTIPLPSQSQSSLPRSSPSPSPPGASPRVQPTPVVRGGSPDEWQALDTFDATQGGARKKVSVC